jgi:hypothetical protein
MANLKLRSTTSATDPGSTSAKGSALTHTEMDSNFILLQADIDGKISAASPTLTGATTIDDELRFNDSDDSNYITVKAPATVGTNYTLTLPDSGGTSGYVLTTDGSGVLTWTAKTVDTTNLVDDTTPQLGGALDVNGQDIVSVSNGDIDIKPNGTGKVRINKITQLTGGQTEGNYLSVDNFNGSAPPTLGYPSPVVTIASKGSGSFENYSTLLMHTSSTDNAGYPNIWIQKNANDDPGTTGYCEDGERLFGFYASGDRASGYYSNSAGVFFKASELHSSTAHGGKIEFNTMDNGSTGFGNDTVKMTIDDDIQAHTAIRLDEVSAPTSVTDKGFIYAKDTAGTAEVYVMDAAGNETQISPHNAQGEWQYYSKNIRTGKTVRINMEQMIRDIEQLTGKTYIENE